jgi:hypothetical protein
MENMHNIGSINDVPQWRKATRSVNNGECVEVAVREAGISVRDSKLPHGIVLSYGQGTWSAFLDSLKSGDPIR